MSRHGRHGRLELECDGRSGLAFVQQGRRRRVECSPVHQTIETLVY